MSHWNLTGYFTKNVNVFQLKSSNVHFILEENFSYTLLTGLQLTKLTIIHSQFQIWFKTRIHSSRIRTARSLTVSHSICHTHPPAMHAPCHACPPAMHAPCHTHPLPCMHPCHTCHPPVCLYSAGPLHAGIDTCPPVDRMTDRCKNITFANYVCRW